MGHRVQGLFDAAQVIAARPSLTAMKLFSENILSGDPHLDSRHGPVVPCAHKSHGCRSQLAAGERVELFPAWQGESFPLYAFYPSRHPHAAKARAFIDFVVTSLLEPTGN